MIDNLSNPMIQSCGNRAPRALNPNTLVGYLLVVNDGCGRVCHEKDMNVHDRVDRHSVDNRLPSMATPFAVVRHALILKVIRVLFLSLGHAREIARHES